MTVVPDHVAPRIRPYYQMANVVETLKRAAALLEPHGRVMVLEPLNFRDHPGMFLTEIPQAYLICKAVNSPSCKIRWPSNGQPCASATLAPPTAALLFSWNVSANSTNTTAANAAG